MEGTIVQYLFDVFIPTTQTRSTVTFCETDLNLDLDIVADLYGHQQRRGVASTEWDPIVPWETNIGQPVLNVRYVTGSHQFSTRAYSCRDY